MKDYKFDLPKNNKSIIKVIGVGGGGSNAVNHMYSQGIKDVEFVVVNTDAQALRSSPVPLKLQLGANLTEGLGAGANPEKGRNAALESKDEVRELLSDNTRMVFITAGMGGGTGTGAAPIIAKIAKDLDILTVGIVTAPFVFEGRKKMIAAEKGIEELRANCDTVLVILNDKLREIYGNLAIRQAFGKADNILSTAAKSIAEIITVHQDVNVDFEDVKTVMKDAGAAVMGSATEEGEDRAVKASEKAIASPLLNNVDITGAEKILLSIMSGEEEELSMDELGEITTYIQERAGEEAEVIFGQGIDPELKKGIRVTVIATGFEAYSLTKKKKEENLNNEEEDAKKLIHLESGKTSRIEEDIEIERTGQAITFSIQKAVPTAHRSANPEPKKDSQTPPSHSPVPPANHQNYPREDAENVPNKRTMPLFDDEDSQDDRREKDQLGTVGQGVNDHYEQFRLLGMKRVHERAEKFAAKKVANQTPEEVKEKLKVPAFMRRNVKLQEVRHSSESDISRYNLNDDNEILGNNRFLHDNVD